MRNISIRKSTQEPKVAPSFIRTRAHALVSLHPSKYESHNDIFSLLEGLCSCVNWPGRFLSAMSSSQLHLYSLSPLPPRRQASYPETASAHIYPSVSGVNDFYKRIFVLPAALFFFHSTFRGGGGRSGFAWYVSKVTWSRCGRSPKTTNLIWLCNNSVCLLFITSNIKVGCRSFHPLLSKHG